MQPIPGAADVVTSKRTIDTTVLAEDQQTIVLGGLIQDNVDGGTTKVPLLGDIPLLGRLFRTDTRNREKRTLLIFLRPTIVRNGEDAKKLTQEKYQGIYEVELRSKGYLDHLPLEEHMEAKLFESPHSDSHTLSPREFQRERRERRERRQQEN